MRYVIVPQNHDSFPGAGGFRPLLDANNLIIYAVKSELSRAWLAAPLPATGTRRFTVPLSGTRALVTGERYHPGGPQLDWTTGQCGGRDLAGVTVPAGVSQVTLHDATPELMLGVIISLVTVVGSGIATVRLRR